MGIQFNIKDAEIKALAEDLGARLGVSKTEAVRQALRAQIKSLSVDERLARIQALTKGLRAHWPKDMLDEEDPSAFLYDENGMPA
jgi:hypothetical protein